MRVQRRQYGQLLDIGAGEWNEIADAVAWVQSQRRSSWFAPQRRDGPALVRLRNAAAVDLDAHSVVAVSVPTFGPSDDLDAFEYRLILDGSKPAQATEGSLAILTAPLAQDEIGLAAIAGVVVCKVDVTDPTALYAAEIVDEVGYLRTAPHGPARILWRESGSSGVKWAVVRLQGETDGEFDAVVTASTARGTSPQSWVYTIKRATVDPVTGIWTAASGAPELLATNKAEDTSHYQHGQSLSPAGATMTPSAVAGPVTAKFAHAWVDGARLYTFDAPNPMAITCP